jgi:hypothetical protein
MSLDDEIDRLYQQPLSSFTAERDALAKRVGPAASEIRRLQKPNAAAWAVNQVYWRRKKVFDRLATASARLRAAHEKKLSGKQTDVEIAEAAHRAALDEAVGEARNLLQQSGDAATAATITAVTDTFHTLVWSPIDGRLTRSLKPTGLEAIAGLLSGPPPRTKAPAEVVPIRPVRPPQESKAEAAKREAAERKRKLVEVDRDLRSARAVAEKAEAAQSRATKALDDATEEQSRLEKALEKATAITRERRDDLQRAREKARTSAAERTRLEAYRSSFDE